MNAWREIEVAICGMNRFLPATMRLNSPVIMVNALYEYYVARSQEPPLWGAGLMWEHNHCRWLFWPEYQYWCWHMLPFGWDILSRPDGPHMDTVVVDYEDSFSPTDGKEDAPCPEVVEKGKGEA